MSMQNSEKVETLVSDILEMCERRGLTIEEVDSLLQMLTVNIAVNINRQNAVVAFKVTVPAQKAVTTFDKKELSAVSAKLNALTSDSH